jgi:hypothetical protein
MRQTTCLTFAVVLTAILFAPGRASAQVPFFNRGAALFDPEISVLTTGVVNDVQATVSPDRKYVTLNMRPANAELVALRQFAFQVGAAALPQGFAGDVAPVVVPGHGGAAKAGNAIDPPGVKAPSDVRVPTSDPGTSSILQREGMTLIGTARSDARPAAPAGSP